MWILRILAMNLAIVFITELSLGFVMGARTVKKIITVALINIITNPAVVLSSMCLTLFFAKWQYVGILVLEVLVVFVEGFTFYGFKTFEEKNPYFISFVLNLLSFATGEIINILL